MDPAEQMYDKENGITWYDHMLDEAVQAMTEIKVLVAEAEEEAEPQIKLIDVLESSEGYGFGAAAAAPEATLPPAK